MVAGSILDGVTGIFHWHNPSDRTVAPGVDSASNTNEYEEYFLGGGGGGVKAAGTYGWKPYHRHLPIVWKSGSLNLLEPSAPVQGLLYRPVRRADNLTTFMCRLSWNLEASISWNPQGLSRTVMGLLYRPVRRADNLTTFMCRWSWNLGASTSWIPQGLSRPVMGLFCLLSLVLKRKILKSGKIRWVNDLAHTREGSCAYVTLVGKG
jgi:hypothetical protein